MKTVEEKRLSHNESCRKWREKNKDKICLYNKQHFQENKEKYIERRNKWRKTKNGILSRKREYASRNNFGFNPINNYFNGAHFHHTHEDNNHNIGIFIPIDLHRSIWHSYKDKESMNKINTIAYKWLEEQYIGE